MTATTSPFPHFEDSDIYYRHEGYGHGGKRKMVRHKVKEVGQHTITTACGSILDKSLTTSVADIAPWQGEKTVCRRCYREKKSTPAAKKLSPAQQKLADRLAKLPPGDTLLPPSGLSSSAWWRTARVLVRLGLAESNGYVLRPVAAVTMGLPSTPKKSELQVVETSPGRQVRHSCGGTLFRAKVRNFRWCDRCRGWVPWEGEAGL